MVSRIIDSFRFLDGTSSARWQTYHSDQHGYEVEVPAGWIAEEAPLSGVTYFYADEHVALVVSVGDASGRINNLSAEAIAVATSSRGSTS